MLASSSQDTYIRIWRLSPLSAAATEGQRDADERRVTEKGHVVSGADFPPFTVNIDAVLTGTSIIVSLSLSRGEMLKGAAGHEDWVHRVLWHPTREGSEQKMRLLSASMDRQMMIWTPMGADGIWMPAVRISSSLPS